MQHWPILPVLLPAVSAGVLTLFAPRPAIARMLALASCVLLLAVATNALLLAADGDVHVYALGDWPPPFGIVLVLDRLSAMMVFLTALLALAALVYAGVGTDADGRFFHALFQFQLMGLNGAFLTGDLFNLFVFFEVLLIASYGLLLSGNTSARLAAGLHYVVINLVGSSLFLVAIALLYAMTGTLNIADLAQRVPSLGPGESMLVQTGALLLLAVFGLKAALFPLLLWLPRTYAAASAPVAALFAIMTKVGVYSILRVHLTVFPAAQDLAVWLVPAALATALAGAVGALASERLRTTLAWLTIMSVGTTLSVVGIASAAALSAALFYLGHSTLSTAVLFLLAGHIAVQRGDVRDRLVRAPRLARHELTGVLFLVAAAAFVGIPPLSGFLGKVMLLQASLGSTLGAAIWSTLLITTLLALLTLTRAGITVFWSARREASSASAPALPAAAAILLLLAALAAMTPLGARIKAFTDATAEQLSQPRSYIDRVLRTPGRT
jgi:multicomponent K+:H+ antiporter subunit D